jgi:hypothetical protein
LVIRPNGCAACHVLFMIANKMKISEQDAADMLSEALLDNNQLNDQFIEMVEVNLDCDISLTNSINCCVRKGFCRKSLIWSEGIIYQTLEN